MVALKKENKQLVGQFTFLPLRSSLQSGDVTLRLRVERYVLCFKGVNSSMPHENLNTTRCNSFWHT